MNRFVSVPRRTLGLFQLSSKVDLLSHLQRPVGSKHPELGHGEGRIHSHVSVQISNLRLKFTKSQIYIQIFATMYKLIKNRLLYCFAGCGASLLHTEKTDHEETCEFRPYSCPCPGASCKWQGSLEQVMSHLMQVHKSITTLQGEDIVFLATDINLPGAVDWVMMQSCFGHHFMWVGWFYLAKIDGAIFFVKLTSINESSHV